VGGVSTKGARYVSTAEVARQKGCTDATIRNHHKQGLIPEDMITTKTNNRGGLLYDSQAPSFRAYIEGKQAQVGGSRKVVIPPSEHQVNLANTTPDERDELTQMLQELTDRWGQWDVVHSWAKVRKEIAQAEAAELKTAEIQGELIRRDFVAQHVIGLVDGMARRLLTDVAHTITKRVSDGAKGGKRLPELKKITHDLIGATINQTKRAASDAIEQGRVVDDDSDG